jgi:hypothetical protein
MVNFLNNFCLFKVARDCYICLYWLRSPSNLSQNVVTLNKRSQYWVRLHIDWVNVEWDSTSTESMCRELLYAQISSLHIDSVDVNSHSAWTQLMWSLTLPGLSWCGVSLCLDSVDVESHSAWTQLMWSLTSIGFVDWELDSTSSDHYGKKQLNMLANWRIKSKILKSPFLWLLLYMFDLCKKTHTKKSHASVSLCKVWMVSALNTGTGQTSFRTKGIVVHCRSNILLPLLWTWKLFNTRNSV